MIWGQGWVSPSHRCILAADWLLVDIAAHLNSVIWVSVDLTYGQYGWTLWSV